MKTFCFLNEDDLENLPKDFKLIPFDVSYLDKSTIEKPKTLTSKRSPRVPKPSAQARLGLSNQAADD